jgi:two-component system response regulator NreC
MRRSPWRWILEHMHLHLAFDSDRVRDAKRADLPIEVVLAVGHVGVRRSLRRLLDCDDEVSVLAEVSDLSTAAQRVRASKPHVLVVDLRLANDPSGDAIRRLRAQTPSTEVIVLTMDQSPLAAYQAIAAGAAGFVLKDHADSELLPAVRAIARGDEFVSPRVLAGLAALRRAVGGDELSPRETEVVRLIALGHTSAEIAAKLRLPRRTVETQRARIYEKLAVTSRAELVRFALRRHLIGG